jgi:hypothetical protein
MSDLDRAITEKVMKRCWHEGSINEVVIHYCCKCKIPMPFFNPSPSTNWQDYGEVLEFILKCTSYPLFEEWLVNKWIDAGGFSTSKHVAMRQLLSPARGCSAILEFFGNEMGYEN